MKRAYSLILILIVGCDITGNAVKEAPKETAKEPVVYFCPEDDCASHLTEFINSANSYVYCAFYDLRLKNVISALAKKSHSIPVKVVIDGNNNKSQIEGKNVIFDTSRQLSHNKFCVVDDKKVWTGSFNPTERDNEKNNNNVIVIYSKYLAQNYKEEFNELWDKRFGEGQVVEFPVVYINDKKIENYFCPEDSCKDQVIEELLNAKKSIYFMTFSFTDEEIADAILFKNLKDTRGVFEKTQAASQYSQYLRLKDFGLNVKTDKNSAFMHHKVFIIDNKTVITGSYNPTGAGNYKNDENVVIIDDENIAKEYLKEFDRVWASS